MLAQKLINSANVSGMDFIQAACQKYGWHFPVRAYASKEEKGELAELEPLGLLIDIKRIHGYTLDDLFQTAKTIWWFKSYKSGKFRWAKIFRFIIPLVFSIVKIYTLFYVISGLSIGLKLNFLELPVWLDQSWLLAATWVAAFILAAFYWLILSRISLSITDLIFSVMDYRFTDQQLTMELARHEDFYLLTQRCFPILAKVLKFATSP